MAYGFTLDMDCNGMLSLTEKNVQLIGSILLIDSNYKDSFIGADGSAQQLFKTYGITQNLQELTKIIEALDKENSTHLPVGDGIRLTVNTICKKDDLEGRLKNGDADLVDEIAKAVPGRYNVSFASKYCTFASRYVLKEDNYVIYDSVIADAIPYYAYYYLNENYLRRTRSMWPELIKSQNGYDDYRKLIKRIIVAAKEDTGYGMSAAEFDSAIWYYYKGNEKARVNLITDKVKELKRKVPYEPKRN